MFGEAIQVFHGYLMDFVFSVVIYREYHGFLHELRENGGLGKGGHMANLEYTP